MIIIGIDPGKSGGIAFMDTDGVNNAWVYKMPETEADVVDVLISVNDIIHDGKVVAYLEEVSAMPKQGVSSVFAFGRSYGFLRGVLSALKITRHFVRPQAWQKELRCLSGGDKRVTKARAQELFCHLDITHATADALLIAEYGRRKEMGLIK